PGLHAAKRHHRGPAASGAPGGYGLRLGTGDRDPRPAGQLGPTPQAGLRVRLLRAPRTRRGRAGAQRTAGPGAVRTVAPAAGSRALLWAAGAAATAAGRARTRA